MTLRRLPIEPFTEIDIDRVTIARVAMDLSQMKRVGFEIRVDGVWLGALDPKGQELEDWWCTIRGYPVADVTRISE